MSLTKSMLAVAALVLLASTAYAGTTYKWTDDKGQVQYTQLPPNDRPYTVIKTATNSQETAPETEEGAAPKVTAAAKPAATKTASTYSDVEKEKLAKNCEIAKQNREMLRTAAKIRVTDEKGEARHLTEEERKARLADTDKQIEFYCK